MPKEVNPERNWSGTANHDIVPDAYPYAYSTHFSPGWRYRRLQELFDKPSLNADDHWQAVTDNKNMMAEQMVPVLLPVLQSDSLFAPLAEALANWDFVDHSEATAPLIFQTLFRNMAYITYNEPLGEPLSHRMLSEVYFWQERFVSQFMQDELRWFAPAQAQLSRQQLIVLAAEKTLQQLTQQLGNDPSTWQWGRAHTLTFFHPLVKSEAGSRWLGGGIHPANGSIETLNRGAYDFHNPEHSKSIASMRIVIDLADNEKVRAHIPGGVSERLFDPQGKNQLPAWLADSPLYWWYSDAAIDKHAVLEQRLLP
jgi:penicillin amidase